VHHDATHKNISGRNPKWRWLDMICGSVAGLALQLDFRAYAGNHLRHHAHTNTAADPDLGVKGPLWQLPLKWALMTVLFVIGALPRGDWLMARLLGRLGMRLPAPSSPREEADRKSLRRFVPARADPAAGRERLRCVLARISVVVAAGQGGDSDSHDPVPVVAALPHSTGSTASVRRE
jgi:hypothetical protein